MCIIIVFFRACDVIIFKINFVFLIKPFFYMTEKSRKKYLQNKNSFQGEIKFFIIFKGFPVAKNCLRPYSAPLIQWHKGSPYLFTIAINYGC